MASRLIYRPESDSVQLGEPGEETRFVQVATYVYDDATLKTVWDVLADNAVPKQGQRYVPPGNPAPPNTDPRRRFICRSVDVSPVPQSPRAWQVRITWSHRQPYDITNPYYRITRSTSFCSFAAYRGDTAGSSIWTGVPPDGTVPYPPTSWISGAKLDVNMNPLTWKIAQQSIQVDIIWDRTFNRATDAVSGASPNGPDPPDEWTSIYCNTRNNAEFLGWPTGYVTYLGWTASPSPNETMVISHKFLADDYYHLEQRPFPGESGTGQPMLDVGATWVTFPTQSAKYVAWYQPYQTLADYSNLFKWRNWGAGATQNLWHVMNNPLPVHP